MSNRLSKFIRTFSNGERSRPGAPTCCDPATEQTSRGDRPTPGGDAPLGYTPQQQMNILHKAANNLRLDSGDKGKHKERNHGETAHHDKRKSIPVGLSGLPGIGHAHSRAHSPKLEPRALVRLEVEMESPPLIMYGTTSSSTGALMSGQFKLKVVEPQGVHLHTLELKLVIEQVNTKPVDKGCPNCMVRKTLLRWWHFNREPTFYKQGTHQFPFSFLLEGHLPATTETPLGSINYVLYGLARPLPEAKASIASHGAHIASKQAAANASTSAQAQPAGKPSAPNTPQPDDTIFRRELLVGRALPEPENDRTAVRVFPPTNLQAICTLPAIIHPITSGFIVQLRLTGVAEHADMGKTVRNWKLKKLSWRLEEHTKSTSAACEKHLHKVGGSQGQRRGIQHEDMRVLGGKEQRDGWKSDYTPPALAEKKGSGSIEMELVCGPKPRGKDELRSACDVDTANGFSVHHKLVIECVVTEEMHPIDKPKWSAPTGVARILRMGFEIKVTERMGMGISWDEEQPPMYEDVPESPPGYNKAQGGQLGDDLTLLPGGIQSLPQRTDIESWEEPPNYTENREAIADDEEWDAHRVDFSEGIRPYPGGRSGSRGWSATGAGEGPSGSSELRSPNVRPRRLDASDLEADPYTDMMRGRDRERDESPDDIGAGDYEE